MAKICKSCGAEYKGDYCDKCGYGRKDVSSKALEKMKREGQKPVRFMTPEEKEAYYAELKAKNSGKKGKKKKAKKISGSKLIVVLLVAAAVILIGLIATGTITLGSKTRVIEQYFQAIEERDYNKFVTAQHSTLRDGYDADVAELGTTKDKYMQDYFCQDLIGRYGEDFRIKTEILSDPVKLDDKQKAEAALASTVTDIKDPYKVDIKTTISGSITSEEAELTVYISKQSGRWKIFYIEATPIPYTEAEMQQGMEESSQAEE